MISTARVFQFKITIRFEICSLLELEFAFPIYIPTPTDWLIPAFGTLIVGN